MCYLFLNNIEIFSEKLFSDKNYVKIKENKKLINQTMTNSAVIAKITVPVVDWIMTPTKKATS